MLAFRFACIVLVAASAGVICSAKTIHRTPGANAGSNAHAIEASEWVQYKAKYSKTYATEREEARRFAIWRRNKRFVAGHENLNFSVTLNHLADIDSQELLKNAAFSTDNGQNHTEYSFEYVPTPSPYDTSLPTQFDWRDKKAIGPVENQGASGSSAAAVVLDVLESQYVITLQKPFTTLSMNEIQRCCLDKTSPWSTSPEQILKCIQDAKGIEFATCPKKRTRVSTDCTVNPQCIAEQIKTWAVVPNQNETLMAEALVNDGPLVALIDASQSSFQFYTSGVYDDSSCSRSRVDHTVLIVGYGVQASDGAQYWIAKNSWGAGWGNAVSCLLHSHSGYIWIKRGANMCGIATAPTNVFVQ